MKLAVIALDYDGTISMGDVLEPAVRTAIAAARASGIVVLLVTGRILDELRRVAGDLHFVDGVIAENGAVLHFPDSGYTSTLAPVVPAAFIEELERRGIPFRAGQCLVDANAGDAVRLLDVIRSLELPLVLAFNKSRVMALPQGVSKATGLHAVLNTLRLSARNTLAVGDAENDHELLRLAEVGVAVDWGSPALRAAADIGLAGSGPAAVADYIGTLASTGCLPAPTRARRRLRLGFTDDGQEFSLAVRGRNVLVAGDANSGKSWVAGLLCEQLIMHGYSVCVLDPEGDYRSLEGLQGVTVFGGEDPPPTPKDLLKALRYPDRSVVVDLSHRPQDEKIEYIRAALSTLNTIRRRTGLPHRIVVDEAHYFLHDDDVDQLLDLERSGYTFVTYRASHLPRALLAATEVMLVTRESDSTEVDALRQWCQTCQVDAERWSMLGRVKSGQAVALPLTEETRGELRLFTMGPRLTPHVRHREKYIDVPVSEHRAFVFSSDGRSHVMQARTLRQFVSQVQATAPSSLAGYLSRGDFSRWLGEIFGDYALATDIRRFEERYRAGDAADVPLDIVNAVRARYDLSPDPA
jgi:hydroxymethylpyrimidine pyrophosphatase-like HAD family hydrolase